MRSGDPLVTVVRMLVAYDARWPEQFRAAASELHQIAGGRWLVEHIGSTAVPGLAAKPVIDLAVRVEDASEVDRHELELARIGYVRNPRGPRTHTVFVRADGGRRTHLAHFFPSGQWETCNQRIFRDWLVAHPADRERYEQVKREAAAAADGGRDYTARKTAVIQEIVDRARAELGLPSVPVWEK